MWIFQRFLAVFVFAGLAAGPAVAAPTVAAGAKNQGKRPNILWITCEDMGPHLGCFGDKFATTPNLDKLAKRSVRYVNAWSNAPVCAPARTTLITGMYAPSTGSEHMRSLVRLPNGASMFTVLLRRLGYYCTNHIKEDYNAVKTGKVWDDSSKKAHYKNRAKGQPFFAVINFVNTHESQIRKRLHTCVLDPKKVPIPPYHPDTPEVRLDWTQYYDNITVMDKMVGDVLRELEEAGLAEDTIVFFYSDHGSGMPRHKRVPYNCGLHVPLMVHFPANMKHLAPADYTEGGVNRRLVSFVDFGPTVLSLAGEKTPEYMQGEAFLGSHAKEPRRHVFGYRGRMDERYDIVRSVRDERFVYVRNFMPTKSQGQYLDYMFQTPTTRVWKKLYDEGKLNDVQSAFWKPHPPEELFDLQTDPHETKNLANMPEHKARLMAMRQVLHDHMVATRDLGLVPEDEMHTVARGTKGGTPYDAGESALPLGDILSAADDVTRGNGTPERLAGLLTNKDASCRKWGAYGVRLAGASAMKAHTKALRMLLDDPSPSVRIQSAETLGLLGEPADVDASLKVLAGYARLDPKRPFVSVQALNALSELGSRVTPVLEQIRSANANSKGIEQRINALVPRLVEKIVADHGS